MKKKMATITERLLSPSLTVFSSVAIMPITERKGHWSVPQTWLLLLCSLFLALSGLTKPSSAKSLEPDCSASTVKLGMSTALSGSASHLGLNVRTGVTIALNEYDNRASGTDKFCLKALDDAYEPALTLPNILTLIEDDHVLAIIGDVGTPTAIAAIPIVNRLQVPYKCKYIRPFRKRQQVLSKRVKLLVDFIVCKRIFRMAAMVSDHFGYSFS